MPLPQELVDLIVDNLHEDTTSLLSCSLAARPFVRPSQRHLFRYIEITPPTPDGEGPSPCEMLHRALITSPHLHSLVDGLRIVTMEYQTYSLAVADGEAGTVSWAMSEQSQQMLQQILSVINLQRIQIIEQFSHHSHQGQISFNWTTLDESLKSALTATFSSTTLQFVHLRGLFIETPKQMLLPFSDATSLISFSVARVFFTRPTNERPGWPNIRSERSWKPKLTSLLVSDMFGDPLCYLFSNPLMDLSDLTFLSVASDDEQWRTRILERVVQIRSPIEHLRVYHPDSLDPRSILTPTLRTLHLFSINMHHTILSTFQACAQRSDKLHLETIIFEGAVMPYPESPLLDDAIKSALEHLPCLNVVHLQAFRVGHLGAPHAPDWGDWVEMWTTSLHRLEERGLLRFAELKGAHMLSWE
ncbi:hypothetical protein FB45DRAFT_929795 [Roridomyces roridus]|uniref:Uncharacterized protein n=1 Tax=Roridomyces roridus TaxID=1738132 RepID=A0AAD7BGL0_9AGAR|nr:hypothetical protein FB45DRAFT_929795 [Roridomyces roridus]